MVEKALIKCWKWCPHKVDGRPLFFNVFIYDVLFIENEIIIDNYVDGYRKLRNYMYEKG